MESNNEITETVVKTASKVNWGALGKYGLAAGGAIVVWEAGKKVVQFVNRKLIEKKVANALASAKPAQPVNDPDVTVK